MKAKTAGLALHTPADAATALLKLLAHRRPEYKIPAAIPRCKKRSSRK